jgi:FtsP/CotA-like multicopper oxidase with cupredoxin domain
LINDQRFARRDFRRTAAAAGGLALLPSLAPAAPARLIRAQPALASLVGEPHSRTTVWTYGGTVPGPELRLKQGERLCIELENLLPEDTTVHWHGIRLPNAMDGVPHLTQPPGLPSSPGALERRRNEGDSCGGDPLHRPEKSSPALVSFQCTGPK